MSLFCLFGAHRPSLTSIVKRPSGLAGLCQRCSRPMTKADDGPWRLADPLDKPIGS